MTKTKTHWRTFHPSKYIGAADFVDSERKILTIAKAGREGVKDDKGREETCLVIHFVEDEKPMICNVTNSKAIDKVSQSAFIEDWEGVKIELYTTTVSAFGEMVEAVRVKQTAPKTGKPELTERHPAYPKAMAAVQSGEYGRADLEKKYKVSDDVWEAISHGNS